MNAATKSISAPIFAREEAERKRKANRGAVAADADELRLLGALIYCEAGNQTYEGMVAVGAVVMNRVKSGAYPNTIHSVIYASGQFTPAMTGKVARVYEGNIPETCLQAAQAAIKESSRCPCSASGVFTRCRMIPWRFPEKSII